MGWMRPLAVLGGGAIVAAAAVAAVTLAREPAAKTATSTRGAAPVLASERPPAQTRARVAQAFARLPLAFQPERGGTFLARGAGASVLLRAGEVAFSLARGERAALLRMQLAGASAQAKLRPSRKLPGVVNEFLGDDPSRWRTNLPTYARLTAHDLYPGIAVRYLGRHGQLRYDFLLSAGADPSRIGLRFSGQRSLRLDRAGNLLLALPGGTLRQTRPRAFQDGRPVAARFLLRGEGQVGFGLGRYDRSRPLLIDPTLAYSTYLGGDGDDYGRGIAVDSSGSAYLAGYTISTNFPTQSPLQAAKAGGNDAFVTKLNASGSALVYSTYLGGSGEDYGYGIAVDSAGSAYVTGYTLSTNFPTASPFQAAHAGGTFDAFVAKLNAAGSALAYASYLGGGSTDVGRGIAVDSSGSAYLTGETFSTNFPTANALQAAKAGGNEAFVTMLNAAGSALVYSTYLGGSGDDDGREIAVDSAGSAYVTGYTTSTNFPTANAFQAAHAGSTYDAFVTKLNAAGSALFYSSYLGGSGSDFGYGIAVDSSGSAYLTGITLSANFPTQSPLQAAKAGGNDAFVTKLNAAGSALVYSSYLGGSGEDYGYGIAVDSAGSAYLTGQTQSTNFPTASPFQAASAGGTSDAFVAKLNAPGSALVYSSYLGGSGFDNGEAIAVDSSGSAYLTGNTSSTNFPTTSALQATSGGGSDVFVTKVGATPTAVSVSSFSARRSGRAVLLRWRATSGASLLGFRLYREAGARLVRLNARLIPASERGRSYVFRDRLPAAAAAARYWLEAVRVDGTSVRYGPVEPT